MATKDVPQGAPILSIDFDGVLHSYKTGWKGARNIPDEPVPGAIEWLRSLVYNQRDPFVPRFKDFDVCVFSSRSRHWGGRAAMRRLLKYGLEVGDLEAIRFPLWKPPAFLQIDDRAIQFTGEFPATSTLKAFVPWNKKSGSDRPILRSIGGVSFLSPKDGAVIVGQEDREVVCARNQPEYNPLRTVVSQDASRAVLSRWSPTDEQRKALAEGKDIYLRLLTFGQPLQPIQLFLADDDDAPHVSEIFCPGELVGRSR